MSSEHLQPRHLEGFDDLEVMAEEYFPLLVDALDERVAAGKPLIDEEFEASHMELFEFIDRIGQLAYHDQDVDYDEAIGTSYRAFHFGLLVSQELIPECKWGFRLDYVQSFVDLSDFLNFIDDDTLRHMQPRPALRSLVDRYMPKISPVAGYEDGAKKVAAIALMQTDKHWLHQFISQQTAQIAQQLDELRGEAGA